MAHIERINWTDSVPDAVAKIAEGNIGAAVCIMDLMKHSEEIDPLSYLVIGPVMLLDSLGIYGPNVWVYSKTSANRTMQECSQCCVPHSWACFKRSIVGVSNRQYRNEGKVKQ
jgi:hypothetical protein